MGLYKKVKNLEKEISSNIDKNAFFILDNAIIEMSKKQDDSLIIFSAIYLQTAIELFIKSYICKVYGFKSILQEEFKVMREKQVYIYYRSLNNKNIQTLGFGKLKTFLKDKNDYFGFVIKTGKSYLYNSEIKYDYLTSVFNKFQNIRNNFLHLGIDISKDDKQWIRNEFYTVVIYFISTIINRDERKGIEDEFEPINVYVTSIDVLMSKLSTNARLALQEDEVFEGELSSIAEDISETNEFFKCKNCGKWTLALNIKETEEDSKCLYCGQYFQGHYCECGICKGDTVVYDGLNIEINNNVILGYCYRCEEEIKVYKCSKCGEAYSYNSYNPINFKYKCCSDNFQDREVLEVDY